MTMSPQLVISGVVVDAATGKPIPEFQIRVGQKFAGESQIFWRPSEPHPYVNGLYTVSFTEPSAGYALQILAADYQPAQSRVFRSDEATQNFDFKMQSSSGPAGVVSLPSGKPAKDAEVAISTVQHQVVLEAGQFCAGRTGQTLSEPMKTVCLRCCRPTTRRIGLSSFMTRDSRK